jgi:hypothetical protein
MPEPSLGQAPVTGTAGARGGPGLINGALDSRADRVAGLPVPGALLRANVLENMVLLARPDGQLTTVFDRVSALVANGAWAAGRGGEAYSDCRQVTLVAAFGPVPAALLLRADGLSGVLVDDEGGHAKARRLACLPRAVGANRPRSVTA